MEIRCRCSACQAKFKVDAKYAGKKARCPKCQQVVEVPQQSIEESTIVPPPAAVPQPLAQSAALPRPVGVAQSATFPKPAMPAAPLTIPPPPAATMQPAATATQPAGPAVHFVPAISTGAALSHAAGGTASPAYRSKKKTSIVALAIGGGIAAVALVGMAVVGVIFLASPQEAKAKRKSGGSTAVATNNQQGTLHLDWPADERANARLSIDGRREALSQNGDLTFYLSPGSHRLLIQRRGYEPIDAVVTLTKNKAEHYAPAWKAASSAVAVSSAPAINASLPADGSTGFPIGTAVGSLAPRGFEGWLQNVEVAGRKAKEEQKDVLVVFGSSDGSPATQQLARVVQRDDVKALIQSRFVSVVIDFPRTSEGYNLIEDTAQNDRLQELYGIREVPVLALLDDQQRPYFIERQWHSGVESLTNVINSHQGQRGERDALLVATATGDDAARLAAAEKAIEWLTTQKLARHYSAERQAWMVLAQKLDADNAAGRFEKFFEPEWLSKVGEAAQREDDAGVLQALRELDAWMGRKFVDPDRGARLHMIAAQLLLAAEQHDDAARHMERASTYEPRDKDLREALASVKQALQNKDVLGSGTGYLISPAGYMLTNQHVVAGEGQIEVRIPSTKETAPAQLIAADEDRDIALIKVALPSAEKYASLAILEGSIRRGSEVAALGYPLGDNLGAQLKLTSGPISSLADESNQGMVLLDLTINPGNSGGPLCDRRGNVVGMITAKTGSFGFEDSYGLAIPASDLLKFLGQHLPEGAPRVEPTSDGNSLAWDEVDAKVSSGVLMVLKKK